MSEPSRPCKPCCGKLSAQEFKVMLTHMGCTLSTDGKQACHNGRRVDLPKTMKDGVGAGEILGTLQGLGLVNVFPAQKTQDCACG